MDFLNKVKNIASKTYKNTSKKTGEIAKEAKLKIKMNEDKNKIKNLYEEIGKIVYQKHINKEKTNAEESINSYCSQIDELSKEVETYQDEILSLRNKRICENCYAEIEVDVKYCPQCGYEQPKVKEEDTKTNEEETEQDIIEVKDEDK